MIVAGDCRPAVPPAVTIVGSAVSSTVRTVLAARDRPLTVSAEALTVQIEFVPLTKSATVGVPLPSSARIVSPTLGAAISSLYTTLNTSPASNVPDRPAVVVWSVSTANGAVVSADGATGLTSGSAVETLPEVAPSAPT